MFCSVLFLVGSVGVGMTKFEKPGSKDWDYPDMGKEAATKALADAGIPYAAVEQACVGYVYGDSTCGKSDIPHCRRCCRRCSRSFSADLTRAAAHATHASRFHQDER